MSTRARKTEPSRPRVLLVGFAGQQGKEYLPVVREHAHIVGGVDYSPAAPALAEEGGFPQFDRVGEALKCVDFEVALVTVPHHAHYPVCRELLLHGKHVIKEKPFAVTEAEAQQLARLSEQADRSVFTLLQRNFNPVFSFTEKNFFRIGEPYWFSYDYHLNLARPTSGWRACREHALGGVLLDMGYHLIDVLGGLFPEPTRVHAAFVHHYREMRDRRLEDLVSVMCGYATPALAGSLRISRHNHEKTERLTILGTAGALNVTPQVAALHPPGGQIVDRHEWGGPKSEAVRAMFAHYLAHLDDRALRRAHLRRQLATVRTIDAIYRSRSTEPSALADRCA
ncbi:Gfo/Idh/MocA family protein [Streptomyces sp. PU-14G]|uniref:Gfo/Idh/MocA family protein n=1 Tax=Streptomyces sp. PU-14G TaxID=2800808 RepID=UPI0034DF2A86